MTLRTMMAALAVAANVSTLGCATVDQAVVTNDVEDAQGTECEMESDTGSHIVHEVCRKPASVAERAAAAAAVQKPNVQTRGGN